MDTTIKILRTTGKLVKACARPRPMTKTMNEWPSEMPNIWGRVRLNPKLAPDASSIRLLGPGVPEATKAKPRRAKNNVISIEGNMDGFTRCLVANHA